MNDQEVIRVIKLINQTWPIDMTEEELDDMIDIWTISLEDVSFDMARKAFKLLQRTKPFRPNTADMMRCVEAVEDQMTYEARLAWTEISSKRTLGYSWEEVLGLISGRAHDVLAEMIRTGVTELKNPLADGTWQILDNKQGFLNLYYVRFEHGKVDNLIAAESYLRLNAPKEVTP